MVDEKEVHTVEDEYKIVYSPFKQRVTREGASVDVLIYCGEHEPD